jgi:hypothetical protein
VKFYASRYLNSEAVIFSALMDAATLIHKQTNLPNKELMTAFRISVP